MRDGPRILGVVMAHGAVQATVERHLPYWLRVCDMVEVWVPKRVLPEHGAVAACRWPNEPHSPVPGKTFKGAFYLHFPQIYSRLALELTVGTIRQAMKFTDEHGYTDRFLGRAVELAGVPVRDWRAEGLAYSWENISAHPGRVDECVAAVQAGALFSHGIKDEKSLRRIVAASAWRGV
jgi:hypothetical protein